MTILTHFKRFGSSPRRMRKTAETSALVQFLESSRLVSAGIFLLTVGAIVLISFVGISALTLPILPNQLASVRIVASAPFSYESKLRTQSSREQQRSRVPPVYHIDMGPYQQFEGHLRDLVTQVEAFEAESAGLDPERRAEALTNLVETFNAKGPYRVSVEDASTFLSIGDPQLRFQIIENGLVTLREVYREGVSDSSHSLLRPGPGAVSVFQIRKPSGAISQSRVQSHDDALTFLRINLAAEGISREAAIALFRIFRNGLAPNLFFDLNATEQLRIKAVETMRPVVVHVEKGQSIIEPGTRVTAEQHEMLLAHRQFLLESGDLALSGKLQLFGRMLLVIAMVIASVFYIRLEDRETLQSNGRLALLALVVVLNLLLVRLTFMVSGLPFFLQNSTAGSLLPYLAPTALAPLILAILMGAGPAIFTALLISIFTAVIYGNRLDLLVITFLASMVGIFACRNVRRRGRVVRAAGLGGLTVACFAFLLGLADQIQLSNVLVQMTAGQMVGLFTGIAVVGLLPILEGLFKRTTDITLLELTDYNHPLLRRMQIEAPGTYHHSLMVANLAENAAGAIRANPLLCRVCSLFHDIGKTIKPEYFTENQRDRVNPHDEKTPSFSALIIKSHVKEGVNMALKHRLPKPIIDVIQQHHGTTLIQYFFNRARAEIRPGTTKAPFPFAVRDTDKVCESTYRYDGPKPQSRESAIILFADSLEAASRSLRKVTPQHLAELIDQIFRDRIEDGQLDECPLTLEEIARIKSSFNFTLLNMLHSRVAYPVDTRHEATPRLEARDVRPLAKAPDTGA